MATGPASPSPPAVAAAPGTKPAAAPSCRLAAVAMVKNECDIIELFVRINARVFDVVHVLDHGSDDGTPEILARLAAEGYPLRVTTVPGVAYEQAEVTAAAVREVARSGDCDFIVPIDADEFLAPGDDGRPTPREVIASLLTHDRHGIVPWRTFCPVADDYYGTATPLFSHFRMREKEPLPFHKVVLGREFARDCTLTAGNHVARSPGFAVVPVPLPLVMQHVPVRSSDQLVRKIVLGNYALSLKAKRGPLEGFHWTWMADRIRERGYRLDAEELLDFALRYCANPAADVSRRLLTDGPRVGTAADAIAFPELARIDLVKSFDAYLGALVAEIIAARP